MSDFQLIMPKMGESIAEATIIRWLKNVGDTIAMDETVLEIATDKVDSEIPTPRGGILTQLLFKEGDVVPVGQVIAVISQLSTADTQQSTSESASLLSFGEGQGEATHVLEVEQTIQTAIDGSTPLSIAAAPTAHIPPPASQSSANRFYSPLVMNIAKGESISMAELEKIPGTGSEGRVTKRDILAYLQGGRKEDEFGVIENSTIEAPSPEVQAEPYVKKVSEPFAQPQETKNLKSETIIPIATGKNLQPGDEIIEMDRMRKLIADHMVMSLQTSPHVTSFVEADVTNLVKWREKNKASFEKREGEKITFTPCFIEAVTKAIKDFPMINVSVDGTSIIKKKAINIGMAAALPTGNLIVPVIKNADNLNLVGLTKAVNDLANKARQNKLSPDDIQGGTFTVTNVGGFGNVMGTPIINQPQVAILATGTIKKKPAVMETEYGETIAIRHMMFLSLSYDHRVVDGALGGTFLRRIADYLEQWEVNREI